MDLALIRRHDRPAPRYTSYPTADRFTDAFGPDDYVAALRRANDERPDVPLSMYMHLPFCWSMCTYCGCTSIVTRRGWKLERYLEAMVAEMDLVVGHLPQRRRVAQLHWGGGTPNLYPVASMARLVSAIRERFDVIQGAEIAVEIDPRRADVEQIAGMAELGFNRISLGVQDLDPVVQEAVGRVQSFEETESVVKAARDSGFRGVNIDLIYGLPHQTVDRFTATMESVLTLRPERVALYSFAWIPWARPHQRKIDPAWLPAPHDKLALFLAARQHFLDAGYVAIGMDHFALPEDPLSVALSERRLHRNFQGYTVRPDLETVAFGISAIGDIGNAYAQNTKALAPYYEAIEAGELPIVRGAAVEPEDRVRRALIHALMCNFEVDRARFAKTWGVDLFDDFADGVARLEPLVADGLVEVEPTGLRVTERGRLLVRVIAACFDRHLHADAPSEQRYSRAV